MATLKALLERVDGFSAAAAVILHRGEIIDEAAIGHTDLRASQPVTLTTLFDLASITKMFTAVAALKEPTLDLDEPISRWLPGFGAITARHLLTHTAGLAPVLPLAQLPDRPARLAAVLDPPRLRAPGVDFEYSCVGFMVLGLLLERIGGKPLPALVTERVTGPLGLPRTGFLPDPGLPVAATEHQPGLGRGMVCGSVHDESSWALGGTAGNAGIFGTARDLARFGEALRLGFAPAEMTRDQLPATIDPGHRHGLGVRIGDPGFMANRESFGHTGFTGTSLVVDRAGELVVALLTNRVHPDRDRTPDIGPLRREVARLASTAVHQNGTATTCRLTG